MSLKKFLRTNQPTTVIAKKDCFVAIAPRYDIRTGQASLEFFILFAVVAVMTIISISSFFSSIQTSNEGLFQKAVGVDGINIGNK